MNKYILAAALLALSACDGDDNEDQARAPEAVQPVEIPDITYVQHDRMGLPGVTTGLLVSDAEKDAYNSGTPGSDFETFGPTALERAAQIQASVVPALSLPASPDASVLQQVYANGDVLYVSPAADGTEPDPLALDQPQALLVNGRMPGTDIMDLLLGVVAANTAAYDVVEDGVQENDVEMTEAFPYFGEPH